MGRRTSQVFRSADLLRTGRFGLLMVLLSLSPSNLEALTCHCFRDRVFDPSYPAKIDPYLVATTSNSFFSAAFGIPKKAVVRVKMSGVSGTDLWIAYFAALRLRLEPSALLASRRAADTWREVLEKATPSLGPLGGKFSAAVRSGASEEDLAMVAAGEMLIFRLGADRAEIDRMRASGVTAAEIVTAAVLSRWTARSPSRLLHSVKGGSATWGSLLQAAGTDPSAIEERVRRSMREADRGNSGGGRP